MIGVAWMLCWLAGWAVLPPVVERWLPPRPHRAWTSIARRLMQWPLFSTRARLLCRVRCRCCALWARPALMALDGLFWPWFVAVTAWEARGWRDLACLTPDDESVPGSDEETFTPDRSEP